MIAKLLQVRLLDKVMVWQFFTSAEDTEPAGSRGVKVTEEEMSSLTLSDLFEAKSGIEILDSPTTVLETIVKRAYDEYLEAKKLEEERKASIVE